MNLSSALRTSRTHRAKLAEAATRGDGVLVIKTRQDFASSRDAMLWLKLAVQAGGAAARNAHPIECSASPLERMATFTVRAPRAIQIHRIRRSDGVTECYWRQP